jgi:YD repeat-containing protein
VINVMLELKRRSGQSGYTLIELLVIIAVMGAVAGVMAMTIDLITNVSRSATAQSVALSQVARAASWIAKDTASAENVTTTGLPANVFCSLQRYSWNGTDNITLIKVDYKIQSGVVTRLVYDSQGQLTSQEQVAQYIDSTGTNMASSGNGMYGLTVKAVYNNSSSRRIYNISKKR